MSNNNERLAAIIAEKLKEKGLIKSDNTSVEDVLDLIKNGNYVKNESGEIII
jgi:hypothetical protein